MSDLKEKHLKTEYDIKRLGDAVEYQNNLFEKHMMEDEKANERYLTFFEKISDQMRETQDCFIKLDKKLDLNIQDISHKLKAINKLDAHQNSLIDEHIKGVNTLKDMHILQKEEQQTRLQELEKDIDKRFDTLETPVKAKKYLKENLMYLLTIAGLATGLVTKIMGLW